MKKYLLPLVFLALGLVLGWLGHDLYQSSNKPQKTIVNVIKPRPLDKYTIENLTNSQVTPKEITIEKTIFESETFNSYLFSFTFDPGFLNKTEKEVTGVINIPNDNLKHPLIVMFRGFVDQESYQSGMGTKRASEFFAKNGFITLAPDFLGYGGSDKEADNVFESRFQTYTTALTTIASIKSISQWDKENVFLWGHSNGGQIALTILAISQKPYPTSLWAPVSKPFPYSVLYYTDEAQDLGKYLRKELSKFEEDYDVNLYSLHNYLDKIKAPIQIHQGGLDDAVPSGWTNSLVKNLKQLNPDVKYHFYTQADHNFQSAWNTVVARDLAFFKANLK